MELTDHRFFPYDKNLILKQAQAHLEADLLTELISISKSAYQQVYNPLGLNDDTSLRIESYEKNQLIYLHTFYTSLCGIYRYKFGNNQLELIWDGSSHFEKYSREWTERFVIWCTEFGQNPQFLKAVLAATVFCKNRRQGELAENRLRVFLNSQFEVRVHKLRGIVPMKVA
ncbi:hypothetical protein RT717_22325 [Imperialibacter roseus]|uniref:Uncharacterized protein n=1 Tax=Imperialibacter roseus TaxID=1324217 RepID=A0ABZ0IMX4_9BACT|nr:hypothetical protein [Imperialibacter roseus]WOK05814.1 hypothetical protein RT717_22325 [Imperialibacter roseus]